MDVRLQVEIFYFQLSIFIMAFKNGEMIVAEAPEGSEVYNKEGLTAQDRIDMAAVGKKQRFNARYNRSGFIFEC